MHSHIDVFQNDWSSGKQILVARVAVSDHGIEIRSEDPRYEEVVLRSIYDSVAGVEVSPNENPTRFFELLPAALAGSYVAATNAHNDDNCPFKSASAIAFDPPQELVLP